MKIQAFIMQGNQVVQRLKVPTVQILETFPLAAGQSVLLYDGSGDIDDFRPSPTGFEPEPPMPQPMQLELAKLDKLNEVRVQKELLTNSVCPTPKGAVDCDLPSRIAILEAVLSPPQGGVLWTMADNKDVFHTPVELRAMALAVQRFVTDVHSRTRQLKSEIASAKTTTELTAIDVTGS